METENNNGIENICSQASNHLASIGKRVYNNEGKNLFEGFTASSAETNTLLTQYAKEAIRGICSELQPVVEDIDTSGLTVVVRKPYMVVNSEKLSDYIKNYAVQYAVGSFLSMTHLDYAKQYLETCVVLLKQIKDLVFLKTAKSNTGSYKDMTSVETINKEKNEQDN